MDAGYKIENIILMESSFKRIPNVTFNNTSPKNNTELNIDCKISGNKVFVTECLNFEILNNDKAEVSAKIIMLGIFEKIGDTKQNPEEFGNINGAAILFPYIREQLSNLSLKAGLGNIILPPANFVKMANDKK